MIKILFIGDIVGKVGRNSVLTFLSLLKKEHNFDLVIANAENATHGNGLNKSHYQLLIEAGIDVITLGNHYDGQKQLRTYIDETDEIIRPLNIKEEYPGLGTKVFTTKKGDFVRVTNLLGSIFMNTEKTDPPFPRFQKILNEDEHMIHIVDFHAEATSEKQAFAWAHDGKVTAVLGTHTHTQTNDDQILPKGTAFISDVGMCGAYYSVIGVTPESIIQRFQTPEEKVKFAYPRHGKELFNAVILEINRATKLTNKITKIKMVSKEDEKSNR